MTPGVIQVTDRVTWSHPQFQIVVSIEVKDREVTGLVECFELLVGMSLDNLPTIEVRVDFPSRLDRVEKFPVPVERGNGTPFRESPPHEFLVFLKIGVAPVEFRFVPSPVPPTEPVGVRSSF